jgi:hypothetical protein
MEISGLPLHVLALHAAVVFGPLAALVSLAYVGLSSWRDRLRWVHLVAVLAAVGAIWLAYLSGVSFFASDRFDGFSADALAKIQKHQNYANVLRWIASAYGVVTILATWQHRRTGTSRMVLGALVVAGAIGTLVWTLLTGDAGARAVWGK